VPNTSCEHAVAALKHCISGFSAFKMGLCCLVDAQLPTDWATDFLWEPPLPACCL
jgi:hypothetical protein